MSSMLLIIIIAAAIIIFTFGIVGAILFFILRPILRNRKILQHGVPGKAIVIGIQETGVLVNGRPQALLTLDVEAFQHGRYQAQARKVIGHFEINQYQPGAKLRVKVDPNNPQFVAVEGPLTDKLA